MTFNDFKFKPLLQKAISQAGFKEPSPIQALAIPPLLEGKDIVGQAHTGTGKTAAFTLPLLQNMKGTGEVETVIIVPTRELAVQVADEVYKFSRLMNIRTATVYGGTGYRRQIEHIKNAGVIVATPGRFLDLLDSKKIVIHPSFVVLDEADEMLNMGFLEDVRRIFQFFGDRSQTLMFSATMPKEIKDLAETLMKKPTFLRVEQEENLISNSIEQYFYIVDEHERDEAIIRLIDFANPKKGIVFCRTKRETERLSQFLKGQGYNTEALHGDMEQYDRREVMQRFRKNQCEILVATDVAARGLDVRDISHVFNYHIPLDPDSYVHRIGRTGRAQRKGTAMMLVTPHELRELKRIQKDIGVEIHCHVVPEGKQKSNKKTQELCSLIQKEKVSGDLELLLEKIQGESSLKDISLKMLGLLQTQLTTLPIIGKTQSEIDTLLSKENNEVTSSSSSRNSRYKKSRRPSTGERRKSSFSSRGTGRGQIPEPTITKTEGGSRIVARKLY